MMKWVYALNDVVGVCVKWCSGCLRLMMKWVYGLNDVVGVCVK